MMSHPIYRGMPVSAHAFRSSLTVVLDEPRAIDSGMP
jgi:hypothetical protein